MPILTEDAQQPRRKPRPRAWWLLLLPPLLAFALLLAASFQPLEFGSLVVVAQLFRSSDTAWEVKARPAAHFVRNEFHGRTYTATGDGWAYVFQCGNWVYGMGWFFGHHVPVA